MGFGGILAAIAGGLGTGMVKISEEAWREAEKEKYYQHQTKEREAEQAWKSEEAEKTRQHDAMLKREEMANAMARTRLAAASSSKEGKSEIDKQFEAGMQRLQLHQARVEKLTELLNADYGGNLEKAPQAFKDDLAYNQAKVDEFTNDEGFYNSFVKGSPVKEAYYDSLGGVVGRKSHFAAQQIKPSEVTAPSQPTAQTSKPIPSADDLSDDQLFQLAEQRREAKAKATRQQRSEEAKKWASEQNSPYRHYQPMRY